MSNVCRKLLKREKAVCICRTVQILNKTWSSIFSKRLYIQRTSIFHLIEEMSVSAAPSISQIVSFWMYDNEHSLVFNIEFPWEILTSVRSGYVTVKYYEVKQIKCIWNLITKIQIIIFNSFLGKRLFSSVLYSLISVTF